MDPESKLPDVVDSPLSSDSASDASDHDEAPIKQSIEWLATARQKRSTAGNRMKSMLANEEPDSDLELLFAEDEDDQGFTDVGEDSDVHMDSSSDDEDENAADDDLEGEKELERQAREKRTAQRKRKAQEAIPAKFRKKVRIDTATPSPAPSSASAPAPRPKKKSERTSWLPSVSDLPTRASSRKTTRLSKEQLHAQMEEREARRLKQLVQMQKKAARMEALKKPPMTQEDRLREAEIVEKRNSKSLNRWEVAEKQREEERRAKLAALNERTLKGPVITFWSGTREWQDGGAARYVVMEEKPKKKPREKKDKTKGKDGNKDKPSEQEQNAQNGEKGTEKKETGEDIASGNKEKIDTQTHAPAGSAAQEESIPNPAAEPPRDAQAAVPAVPAAPEAVSAIDNKASAAEAKAESPELKEVSPLQAPPITTPAGNTSSPVSGLAAPAPQPSGPLSPQPRELNADNTPIAAVLAPPMGMDVDQASSKSQVLAPPNTSQSPQPSSTPQPAATPSGDGLPNNKPADGKLVDGKPVDENSADDKPTEGKDVADKPTEVKPTEVKPTADKPKEEKPVEDATVNGESIPIQPAQKTIPENPLDSTTPSEQPPEKKEGSTYTRNAIVYQNFDEAALKDKSIQVQILFGRKMNKLAKPAPRPLCVITHHPARYRDPQTGLPFYNAYAYGEIRRLERGDYRWSKLLSSWVGSGKKAATGVPERFLNPNAPGPKKDLPPAKKEEAPTEEQEKTGDKANTDQGAAPPTKTEQATPEVPMKDIQPQQAEQPVQQPAPQAAQQPAQQTSQPAQEPAQQPVPQPAQQPELQTAPGNPVETKV